MRTWPERSFELVEAGGYLDKLIGIYPATAPGPRGVPQRQLQAVREAVQQPDDFQLLHVLLQSERFPFNSPYVGVLRRNPRQIESNPATVHAICHQVRAMGAESVIDALRQPKEQNRRMGPMFKNWLREHYPFAPDAASLHASSQPVVFLAGGGERLRQFANAIGCGLRKQPDFVGKTRGRYIVGEAKWIGTEGGNQNRAFDDALALASSSFARAVTVAVLDGIVWIRESGQMSRRLANFSGNALSALLLRDFLESL